MAEQQPVEPVDEKENALKRAISFADSRSYVVKGLHQVCKRLADEKKPKFVILAQNADDQYKKLVTALCKAEKVPLLPQKQAETLGEWLGFCKRDINKKIRKRVKCSSLALLDFAPETKDEEKKLVLDMLK